MNTSKEIREAIEVLKDKLNPDSAFITWLKYFNEDRLADALPIALAALKCMEWVGDIKERYPEENIITLYKVITKFKELLNDK